MKKNVLIFGLISGLIVSGLISMTAVCYNKGQFEGSMILGFTVMILAFSVIFVGIKNYRDHYNNGTISFGKGLQIGLLISLIASSMYVLSWLIVYYNFMPDFMEKYSAYSLEQIKSNKKLTATEVKEKIEQINWGKDMYKSPIGVILTTYIEILPVGIIVTLISALILRRKQQKHLTDTSLNAQI